MTSPRAPEVLYGIVPQTLCGIRSHPASLKLWGSLRCEAPPFRPEKVYLGIWQPLPEHILDTVQVVSFGTSQEIKSGKVCQGPKSSLSVFFRAKWGSQLLNILSSHHFLPPSS
ncbi:MAG: hypothetical protein C4331_19195 [Meiothermus sp.]